MSYRYWSKKVTVVIVIIAMFFGNILNLVNSDSLYVQANASFLSGTGEITDPYQINTEDQLNEVRNHLNSHFILKNDLELSDYDASNPWEPIGSSGNSFTGSLDGNDFKILKLYVDTTISNDSVGLFGHISGSGSIRNLVLEDVYVEGEDDVGALVGFVEGGSIENVTVTGSVYGLENVGGVIGYSRYAPISDVYFEGSVEGINDVGGLIGDHKDAKISNSSTRGSVSGEKNTAGLVGALKRSIISESFSHATVTGIVDAGGLIGNSEESTIEYSYATGNVTGAEDTGGLIGDNDEGVITYSYATGTVNGDDSAGGLVGDNKGGQIEFSYATGIVTANDVVGGLVGNNKNGGTIKNSYATGNVTGGVVIGGLVGDNEDGEVENSYSIGNVTGNSPVGGLVGLNVSGNIVSSFYNTETSGQSDNNGLGVSTLEMKNGDLYVDWQLGIVWDININNDGYPYLKALQTFITYVSNDSDQDNELTTSYSYIPNSSALVIGNSSNWSKQGYIFTGWNSERDGSGTFYDAGDSIASDASILLYAIWAENNENLSGLNLSTGASLHPDFAENVTDYTTDVAHSVSSIQVTPIVVASGSTVTVAINDEAAESVTSGQASTALTLAVGVNTIKVVVKAIDGTTTKPYTVTVTRNNKPSGGIPSLSSNADLKQLSVTGGSQLDTEFSSDTLRYTLNVDSSLQYISVTPTLADEKATVELLVNGDTYPVTSGSVSNKLELKIGANMIDIIITAENGSIKRYTLTIVRNEEIEVDNKCLFNDIEHHWAKAEICEAASLGIVKGTSAQHFEPNIAVTRAEFVAMLLRTLQVEQLEESIHISFPDQDSIPEWARPAIYTALKQGIIEGYLDGTLRPLDTINRAEMAAIIARVMNWQKSSNKTTDFADDISIPEWAKGYVQVVREQGILLGKTRNTFVPFGVTTRAEATVTLLRLWNIQ